MYQVLHLGAPHSRSSPDINEVALSLNRKTSAGSADETAKAGDDGKTCCVYYQMSKEQLKAFSEKVKSDSSLQEKLKAVATPDGQIAFNDVIKIAKEAGFVITASDLAVKEGLTEEQLEAVTGGKGLATLERTGYGLANIGTLGFLALFDQATGSKIWKGIPDGW